MIRAHITVPKHSDMSLMGILEKRISGCFTNYCMEPTNGLGVFVVTMLGFFPLLSMISQGLIWNYQQPKGH
jgi:hypothetical protein